MRGRVVAMVLAVLLPAGCAAAPAASQPRSSEPRLLGFSDLFPLVGAQPRGSLEASLQAALERLEASRVPTADEAIAVATRHRLGTGGLRAEESLGVAGLFPLGVELPGFAAQGDLVWIVRVIDTPRGLTDELWISSTTAEVRALVRGVAEAMPLGSESGPAAGESTPLWCMESTGLPTPRFSRLPLGTVTVATGQVTPTKNVYQEAGMSEAFELTNAPVADWLDDGSLLVWVPGNGDWSEGTALLLQLDTRDGNCRLLSCHLQWWADIPPFGAWCRLDGGSITIECPSSDNFGYLGLAFSLDASIESSHLHVAGRVQVATRQRVGGIPAAVVAEFTRVARP